MRWQREGGYKDAEVYKGKSSGVCDDGGSNHQFIQVMESCRCAGCGGNSEMKLLLVLNKRKLAILGETKPWCFTRGSLNLIRDSEISYLTMQLHFLT